MKHGLLIGMLFLFACESGYERFKDIGEKAHYKLIAFGDNEISAREAEYIAFSFKYCSNELCIDKQEPQLGFASTESQPEFWKNLHLGDELVLLLDSGMSDSWLELLDLEDKVLFYPIIAKIKLVSIYDHAKYSGPPMLKELLLQSRESIELEKMIERHLGDDYIERDDCYIQVTKVGDGDSIDSDKEVILSYKAYLPDGTKFDDTDLWKDTLNFHYGQPFQIIKGLEIGIRHLSQGSEAKLIIPSHLAFGKEGSSSGIIRPYEPLFYDLKIISVTTSDL